jgi:small conductance mechanosensitive channel
MDASTLVDESVELVTTWGVRVVGAILVLIAGRMVAALLRRSTRSGLERAKVDETLVPFLANGVYYFAIAVVLIAVLQLFGIQTTSLVAMVGAAGLAVGLAMQGTLSNFAAGVMLLFFRPFQPGDYVEIGGTAGSVQEIGLFSTLLHTPDNVKIIVPNAAIWGSTIKNYSANETRRNDLVIGISYTDDIGKGIETIQNLLNRDERVLRDPEPQIAVAELADSSVNLVVRPWCKAEDYWPLRFDLTRSIKEELEAAGCSIPFPQHDVHVIPPG